MLGNSRIAYSASKDERDGPVVAGDVVGSMDEFMPEDPPFVFPRELVVDVDAPRDFLFFPEERFPCAIVRAIFTLHHVAKHCLRRKSDLYGIGA